MRSNSRSRVSRKRGRGSRGSFGRFLTNRNSCSNEEPITLEIVEISCHTAHTEEVLSRAEEESEVQRSNPVDEELCQVFSSTSSPASESPTPLSTILNNSPAPSPLTFTPCTSSSSKRLTTYVPKRSEWWDHYIIHTRDDGTSVRKCKYCPHVLLNVGGTGNMSYHIRVSHPDKLSSPRESPTISNYFGAIANPFVSCSLLALLTVILNLFVFTLLLLIGF